MNVHKILCCCISGLGSSFIVEMNVKKALKQLGKEDIEVAHAGINDAMPGMADLYICSADVKEECEKAGDTIALDKLTDLAEVQSKLTSYFQNQ